MVMDLKGSATGYRVLWHITVSRYLQPADGNGPRQSAIKNSNGSLIIVHVTTQAGSVLGTSLELPMETPTTAQGVTRLPARLLPECYTDVTPSTGTAGRTPTATIPCTSSQSSTTLSTGMGKTVIQNASGQPLQYHDCPQPSSWALSICRHGHSPISQKGNLPLVNICGNPTRQHVLKLLHNNQITKIINVIISSASNQHLRGAVKSQANLTYVWPLLFSNVWQVEKSRRLLPVGHTLNNTHTIIHNNTQLTYHMLVILSLM